MKKPILAVIGLIAGLSMSAATAAEMGGKTEVHWYGQAGFKITSPGGKVIVIDPFILKNPKTPKPLKDLKKLGKVDVVLVTHGHFDHIADAPAIAKMNTAKVFGPAGLMDSFADLGILPVELAPRMNKGGVVTPIGDAIKFTMVRAEHSSELKWNHPDTGKPALFEGGEPAGWIIEMENGFKIYHMGDTGLFGDMEFIGAYYKPDLVLMPIGGHFVMSPKDAAYATKKYLKPAHVIPMHYGTIPVLKGTPAEYIAAMGNTAVQIHAINPGEKISF